MPTVPAACSFWKSGCGKIFNVLQNLRYISLEISYICNIRIVVAAIVLIKTNAEICCSSKAEDL